MVSSFPPAASKARPASNWQPVLDFLGQFGIGFLLILLILLAWLVALFDVYSSGSDFGYNLGLAGGLLMLSLLLYPLRKRVARLQNLGSMEWWFRYHIFAGVTGPLLVMFHSTFKLGSMNGSVAMYSMLLVAGSGVVGRFLYRHIYRGLTGHQVSLAEARAELVQCSENLELVFALRQDIQPRLQEFSSYAFQDLGNGWSRAKRFVTLRSQARRLADSITTDAKSALRKVAREQQIPRKEIGARYKVAKDLIYRYLDSVVRTSQLRVWERLFSLWHVLHLPFLYLLLISGIVHVVAVHMY